MGYKGKEGPSDSGWHAPREFMCPSDVVSRKERIQALMKEIRDCKVACREVKVKRTPLVYSSEDPKIMIVSEVPPFTPWSNGLGDEWASGTLSIPEGERYKRIERDR